MAEESPGVAKLIVHHKHSTAQPIEPGPEETLKIAASGKEDYPGAKHEFEERRGDALLSPPGLPLLSSQHAAFITEDCIAASQL